MVLLLDSGDIEGLLDLQQAIDLTYDVFREQAAGNVVAIPPKHIDVPKGTLRIVSGALIETQRMGLRSSGANALASSQGVALLYDSETADLLSVMAYPFGTLRTGAVFGVATQLLANKDAHTIGMIGTGRNALSLLSAACLVRPINDIKVYGRNLERRVEFAKQAQDMLGVAVEAVDGISAATEDADIVYVSTNSLTPVLQANCLSSGVFVASMGTPCEIDDSVYLVADRITVSTKEHEEGYGGVWDVEQVPHTLLALDKSGKLPWHSVYELCDIVAKKVPGRTSESETIVFKESQGGYGDIAFASWIYASARKKGIGVEWNVYE